MKKHILKLLREKKLNKEDMISIVAYIQATRDPDVINCFIENNLPLARCRAQRYHVPGVDFEDLMQEGCIGILDSLNDFDITLGFAFSTYAVPKIDHRIRLYVAEHSSVIRVPRNVHYKQQRVNAVYKLYFQETGDKPCHDTIADKAQVRREDVPDLLNLSYLRTPTSLDQPTITGSSISLSELIPDDRDFVADTLETVHWDELRTDIRHILSEQEYTVICLRFYLDEPDPQPSLDEIHRRTFRTLQACGDILGCSRENVRRVLAGALSALSEHTTIRHKYACNE